MQKIYQETNFQVPLSISQELQIPSSSVFSVFYLEWQTSPFCLLFQHILYFVKYNFPLLTCIINQLKEKLPTENNLGHHHSVSRWCDSELAKLQSDLGYSNSSIIQIFPLSLHQSIKGNFSLVNRVLAQDLLLTITAYM